MNKKSLVFLIALIFLVGSTGFVYSQEEGLIEIIEGLVLEGISVSGIGVEGESISSDTNKVEFTGAGLSEGESSYVKIGDVEFPNIASGSIEFGKNGEMKKIDILTGDEETETSYWVNGNEFIVPANSQFIFNEEDGFTLPEGTEVKEIGSSTKISGEDFKLWRGEEQYDASGNLKFDAEGNVFIQEQETASINGVEMWVDKYSYPQIPIFFDGQEHEGDFISFGEDKILLKGEEPNLIFHEENPYVKIEKGDYLEIEPLSDSRISVEKRGEELIPKLTVKGSAKISNDGKIIMAVSKKFLTINSGYREEKTTTSPIEIILEDNKDEKIFVDNFDRFAVVPRNVEEYFADSEGINVKFSARVKYNYLNEENFEELIGKSITFGKDYEGFTEKVDEGAKQMILGRLRDYWATLTPETQSSFEEIIVSDSEFIGEHSDGGAMADETGRMFFREHSDSLTLENFRHEAAHIHHFRAYGDWRKTYREIEEFQKLDKKATDALEQLYKLDPRSEEAKILNEKYKAMKEEADYFRVPPISRKWYEVSVAHPLIIKYSGKYYYQEIIDGEEINSQGARYGYASPYGATDIMEDIAEHSKKINNIGFWKEILSEENEWNEIYREKLKFLHEEKFISDEEYYVVLEAAGLE